MTVCFDNHLGLESTSPITGPDRVLRDQMLAHVGRAFKNSWDTMLDSGRSAAALHKEMLESESLRSHWKAVRSNVFCAICITRRPEHVLKCRHAICDACAKKFGAARGTEEYAYLMSNCLACGDTADLLVRLKPPTAGLRVIGMDGGGLRGIISLEFFRLLQKSLGSSCQLQDLFDLALGTSVGKYGRALVLLG